MEEQYILIRSKRKTIGLTFNDEGHLLVRAPMRMPVIFIERFIAAKNAWIAKHQKELIGKAHGKPNHQFLPGEEFLYRGKTYTLVIQEGARNAVELRDNHIILSSLYLKRAKVVLEKWYRNEAKAVFEERLAFFAVGLGVRYKILRISTASSRWGSYSTTGTLSLNWKIIMAPPEVLDYVVVHELSHIREHNHQKPFWDLVSSVMPDYKQHRAWIQKNGYLLSL